jgi:hypothetical protein
MSCATDTSLFPANYTLPPVVTGDKWQGFSGVLTEDATAPADACTDVVFQIHTSQAAQDGLITLKESDGEITLDVDTWEFSIIPLVMTLAAGTYYWAVAYLDNDGDPITVGEGSITVNAKGVTP